MTIYVGTSGNDIFAGTPDDDVAVGMDGNDSLTAGLGYNILAGNAGADTLVGGASGDVLFSGDITDDDIVFSHPFDFPPLVFDTGTEVDWLIGGGLGNDKFFAGYGDNVDGGDGPYQDYLYISFLGASTGVNADFRLESQVIGGGTIQGIETLSWVQGTNYGDTINAGTFDDGGYARAAPIEGMAGDDLLISGYKTGHLLGGAGDDTLDGRINYTLRTLDGGAGDDVIYDPNGLDGWYGAANGGDGDDYIETAGSAHGGAGDDRIVLVWVRRAYSVFGDDGNDTLSARGTITEQIWMAGGAGADVVSGSVENDRLSAAGWGDRTSASFEDGGAEHDVLSALGGEDVVSIGFGDDADGGAGADTLILNLGGANAGVTIRPELLVGHAPYTLAGGVIQNFEYVERLVGSAFGDTFDIANPITMTINGAGGVDTLDFTDLVIAATVRLGLGADAAGTGPAGTTLYHIENLIGTGFGDDFRGSDAANLLAGGDGNDRLYGAGGDDTLEGGAGTDILQGGVGNDLMVGGGGVDTATYSAATAAVAVTLGSTAAQDTGGAGIDTLQQIESLGGSAFADTLTGSTGANTLSGAGGDDTLLGGKGSDLLDGGDGGDLLVGGHGDDTLVGGAGSDYASYRDATAGVTVDLAIVAAQDTHGAGIDMLTGIEGLRGSAYGDSLRGTDGSNVIDAAEGDDLVWGYAGSDRLTGGLGRDKLWGGEGADRLDGGDGNDVLRGGDGGDRINGDAGIDLIYGDGGIDVLTGGLGADRFVYTAIGDAGIGGATYDRIADFSHAEGDRIDLTAIDAVAGGGDNAFAFAAGGAFTGVAGQLIVTHSGADWLVRGDVNGDAVADFAIQVTSATALAAGDFFL